MTEVEPSDFSDDNAELELISNVTLSERYWKGPLPPPNILNEYNNVYDGLAKHIVDFANKEQDHRHRIDIVNSRRESMGLAAGFVIAVLFLFVAAWLTVHGHDIVGISLGMADLGALLYAFRIRHRWSSPS